MCDKTLSQSKKSPRATIDNAKRITHERFHLADTPGAGHYASVLDSDTIAGRTKPLNQCGTTFAGRYEAPRSRSPGPTDYTPNRELKLKKGSSAIIATEKKKPLFHSNSMGNIAGPGTYNP